MHVNDADGLCARVRLDYKDDTTLLATRYGNTMCIDDDHHEFDVALGSYSDSAIDRVRVVLEKETRRAGRSPLRKPTTSSRCPTR
jgi:hypothetical protein